MRIGEEIVVLGVRSQKLLCKQINNLKNFRSCQHPAFPAPGSSGVSLLDTPSPWGIAIGAQLYSSAQRRPIAMHLVLLVRLPNTELSNFDFSILRIIHDGSSIWPAPVFSPGAPMMKSVRPGICRNNVYDVRIHDRKFFTLFICLHSNF